jgi:homoserine kinase
LPGSSHQVLVRPPATTANLGPGFDALGAALGWYDDVELAVTESGLTVEVTGEGAGELQCDERHLVVRAARAAFDVLGGQPAGLALRCHNRIPQARGLGSSSAAVCAGIVAARAVVPDGVERLDDAAVLALATAIEGHPDNVAACLLGGVTIAWRSDGNTPEDGAGAGSARAVRLAPAPGLTAVVCVPTLRGYTHVSRGLLPAEVPHSDAAATAGRAALLIHALSRDPALLLPATRDWLHQGYRASSMPSSALLIDALRARGIAAVVSGAGPSVLALGYDGGVEGQSRAAESVVQEIADSVAGSGTFVVIAMPFGVDGVQAIPGGALTAPSADLLT